MRSSSATGVLPEGILADKCSVCPWKKTISSINLKLCNVVLLPRFTRKTNFKEGLFKKGSQGQTTKKALLTYAHPLEYIYKSFCTYSLYIFEKKSATVLKQSNLLIIFQKTFTIVLLIANVCKLLHDFFRQVPSTCPWHEKGNQLMVHSCR